ncbi:MAG TPA: hypothetical protein VFK80_06255, partial [Limnochordia bacterium]|nr:hypothetical protein [Limnochordia bacterium]
AYYHVQPDRLVALASAEIPVEAATPGAYKAVGLRVADAVRGSEPAFETVWRPDLKVIYLHTQSRFGATLISVQPSDAAHVARVTIEVSQAKPTRDPAALAVPLERALARGLGFGAQGLQANVALFGRSVSPLLAGGAPRPFGDLPERLGLRGVQVGVAGRGRTLTAYTPFLGRHQAGAQGKQNFALALIPQGQGTRIVAGSPGLDAALLAEAE